MPSPRPSWAGARTVAALGLVALATAFVVQASGPNQAAHFGLVRSLANGTAEIDPRETVDASYVDGRYYAAKAPGLALYTLPWYGLLEAVGLQDGSVASEEAYRDRLWEVNLFGSVLPMLVLLLLMVVVAERFAPGYGLAAAVLAGVGTLLLPFATLYFDHVLSAALGFAAFVVLVLQREGRFGDGASLAAGLLAGLAIVTEFPLGIVALVLAALAVAGPRRGARLARYAAGLVVGVAPLLVYNTLVFGSPTTLSYTNALKAEVDGGAPIVGANEKGFYGVGWPDPRDALSLLASEKGLLVVTPLALVALLGLPLLWRAGRRAEALVCGAVPLLFLAYNAAYYLPFGGQGPGPRFLVPALPFLAVPLALVLRARPLVVGGIGVVSAGVMALATITRPLTGVEYSIGLWLDRLGRGETVETVAGRLGIEPSWVAALPFGLLLLLACAIVLAPLPLTAGWRREAILLLGAVGAWVLIVLVTPDLVPADGAQRTAEGSLAAVLLLATLGIAAAVAPRAGLAAALLLAPAVVLALPALDSRPRWSLLVAAVAFVAGGAAWLRLRRTRGALDSSPPPRRLASP